METLAALERRQPGKGWAERALGIVQRAKARDLLDALGGGKTIAPQGAEALRAEAGEGAVLEYFLGESNLYLWVIRSGGVRFLDLGDRRPVLAAAEAVHRALSHGEEPPAAALAALSRTLLGAAGPLPTGDAPLRIAPDGALHHLPFEILAVSGGPLVERSPVSYLPSASALAGLGRAAGKESVRLLGFGDPLLERPGKGSTTPRAISSSSASASRRCRRRGGSWRPWRACSAAGRRCSPGGGRPRRPSARRSAAARGWSISPPTR